MSRDHTRLVGLLPYLRWAIPLAVALIGIGYILFEQVVLQGHALSGPYIAGGVLFLGLVGPVLVWLALTWAAKAALADAKAQQEPAFYSREMAFLSTVGEAASRFLDQEGVLQAALEKMVELIGLQAGGIWLVEGERLVLKTHYGLSSDFLTRERTVQLDHCLCGTCAQTGETLVIDDLAAEPSLADNACAREGFQSIISVPMKVKGRVVGVIHVASSQKGVFSPRDQQILTAVGNRVATAVENAWLYEEAQRRAVYLEAASLVGRRITTLSDLDSLLAEVVRLIREKFGYYCTYIFLVDEGAKEAVLKEASGPAAELIKTRGLRFKIGQEGIIGRVAHTGQALLCNDVSHEPCYYTLELAPGTKAELAVPMQIGKRVVGVLDVQSDQCDAFDQQDVIALRIIGNQVSIAIENVRLFQETMNRYEAMVALHETSLDMISQLDMAELLEALLRRGVHLLGAQAGSLFLYDAARETIHNVANYNTWRDWRGVTLRPGEGVVGQVVLTGEPLIVNDYENWVARAAAFAGTPHTVVMGAPLRWQDQIIGGVIVLNESSARPFDRSDLWLLSLFADSATCAIKNSELHTQVKEFSQRLERKVEERTRELSTAKEEISAKARQLRSLLAKTIRIQEEEQARIAHDMHDTVIQLVAAARYELRAAKVAIGSTLAASAEEKFNSAREMLGEIEGEIRNAIYNLTPSILNVMDTVHALQKHASNFQEVSGISCHVQVVGVPFRLPPAIEVASFRMVQEALYNVATHAGARAVSITVDFRPAMLCVTVQDDGQGFDYGKWSQDYNSKHLGLLGMRERTESLGGEMKVWSEPGHGTRVMFRLPVQGDGGQQTALGVTAPPVETSTQSEPGTSVLSNEESGEEGMLPWT